MKIIQFFLLCSAILNIYTVYKYTRQRNLNNVLRRRFANYQFRYGKTKESFVIDKETRYPIVIKARHKIYKKAYERGIVEKSLIETIKAELVKNQAIKINIDENSDENFIIANAELYYIKKDV